MVSPGWSGFSSGSSSQLPVTPPCWRSPAGARSRVAARTNELDSDERRTIMGSEEGFLRAGLCRGSCVFPGVAGGVVSQAPIRRRAGVAGGRHDHVSGDRAAQSEDRGRPGGRLMPQIRACPESGDPPVWAASWWSGCSAGMWLRRAGRPGGLRLGEQVVAAGQELAGDRDGGHLLPAPFRDRGISGAELRGALRGLRCLAQDPAQPRRALLICAPSLASTR